MMQNSTEKDRPVITMPRSRFGKVVFWLLLVLWFAVLLLPCALFYLATGSEITFQHADVPAPEAHPLLQIGVIMDVDNRGLQITRSNIQDDEGEICVQTRVNYLLWESDGSADAALYCDCYAQDDRQFLRTTQGACP